MYLGLLTDIHEHVDPLREALAILKSKRVDQIVVLGDVFEMGKRIDKTVELLVAAGAVGVWGNHDFGLSFQPTDSVRSKHGEPVIEFMTTLRPRLELEDCLFTHVEPWLNTEDLADLWYFDGPPDTVEKSQRSFSAVANRYLFLGHFHRWLWATDREVTTWNGGEPIDLDPSRRHLIVVGPVFRGDFATFDTATGRFEPFTLVPSESADG